MKLNRKALKQLIRESLRGVDEAVEASGKHLQLQTDLQKWAQGPGSAIAKYIQGLKNPQDQATAAVIMMKLMKIDMNAVFSKLKSTSADLDASDAAAAAKPEPAAKPMGGGAPPSGAPADNLAGMIK